MDEFGMGGTGTTGHTGIVKNPWDTTRMCAGSSAGSAAAVAAGYFLMLPVLIQVTLSENQPLIVELLAINQLME